MDAITMLKQDHKTVESLFKKFEKTGEQAYAAQKEIVDKVITELSIHAAIEEQVFYPSVRAQVSDTEDEVLEALEEHHVAKWLLSELDGMDPRHERFRAKTMVLIESVRHHVEEEETELFPQVRQALGRKILGAIGEKMEEAKKTAPTHPHPKAPDEPPGNLVVGAAAGLVDRVRDGITARAGS